MPDGPQSFPRACRMLTGRDYDAVMKGGRRVSRPSLSVLLLARAEGELPRLGLVIGRKQGNAVVRNLMRRRFREIFRTNRARFTAPWDVVVLPKVMKPPADFATLRGDFLSALERAGIILPLPAAEATSSRPEAPAPE